jgi:hypothetical protein
MMNENINGNDFLNTLKKEITTIEKKWEPAPSIDGIINYLPEMLKAPCQFLVEETEKEVFLIGALGVVSGMLPNINGIYAGKVISPNLYVYILSGYGEGKGGLDYARQLGKQVHQAKKEEYNESFQEYSKDMEVYKKLLKDFHKSKSYEAEPPEMPQRPPSLMLFIPANNSKSGIYQLLFENNGRGILFETEGDTLADALKQDYGGFSDTLRKAFHHERLDLFRRMNNEHIEIQHPELSVVLSSTFDQLKKLIPSVENGLYSRFLYYELKQNSRFIDVFDNRKNLYHEYFEKAGEHFKELFDRLEKLNHPIRFSLTKEQQNRFIAFFDERKSKMIVEVDTTMAGMANRLGVIAYRIMMVFTALRAYENEMLNASIQCNDVDFDNALQIVNRLEKHAKTVYEFLNSQPNKKKLAIELRKMGKSYGQVAEII